ncbi:hypothetical protein INR49_030155 [Caranx melampygus]|nr:hypothetical protein INR49_030155 [Caranx melampygus]
MASLPTLPCPNDAPRRLPNHRMTSLHRLYARRAHGEFVSYSTHGVGVGGWTGGGGSPWPPRPGGQLPRLCQTFLIPHFPLSTFPLKKQPGVTSLLLAQLRKKTPTV